jgi:hypothetical protein
LGGFANAYDFAYFIFEDSKDIGIVHKDSYETQMGDVEKGIINFPKEIIINSIGFDIVENKSKIETVYFSPFLDFKDLYFQSEFPDIDVSLEGLMLQDSQVFQNDDNQDAKQLINHRYQNLLRHILFQKFYISNNIKLESEIPLINRVTFKINPFLSDNDVFPLHKKIYHLILNKWKEEINTINGDWMNFSQTREINLWFLIAIIRNVLLIIEKSENFLGRDLIDYVKYENLNTLDAKYIFYHFLESYAKNSSRSTFPDIEKIKTLINKFEECTLKTKTIGSKIDFIVHKHEMVLSINYSVDLIRAYVEFQNSLTIYHFIPYNILDINLGRKSFSSGEKAFLDLYSRIFHGIKQIRKKENMKFGYNGILPQHYLILLDEGDMGFHPIWKKKFVKSITDMLPKFFEGFEDTTVQIIFTTHDALTLSDMPNYNVVYLDKIDEQITVLNQLEARRPMKSFGANISELLADSFFLEGGLVGDFAVAKIDKTITWLNSERGFEQPDVEYHRKVIDLIDEPIIKKKLSSMFSEKVGDSAFEQSVIIKQMKRLENQLRNLKNPEQ